MRIFDCVVGDRQRRGMVLALALASPLVMSAPAWACDSKEKKAENVIARLAGDRPDEADLNYRLIQLEMRLREVQRQLHELSEALAGAQQPRNRRGGVGPVPDRAPRLPFPPGPAPPLPASPEPYAVFAGPEAVAEALERYSETQEHWQGEWRDQFAEWQDRQAEFVEQWRERQAEMTERQYERQAEMMAHWREAMDQWRDRVQVLKERSQERATRQMKDASRALADAKRAISGRRRGGALDEGGGRVVYDVTGEHADRLFELLAPNEVRAIVSRDGEHIAVLGTRSQHATIHAMLQLLNWVDRDEVFDEMIDGERTARKYELGRKRAELLFDMLAPNDVKVFVSREGESGVSAIGTAREHEVLADFINLLHWSRAKP